MHTAKPKRYSLYIGKENIILKTLKLGFFFVTVIFLGCSSGRFNIKPEDSYIKNIKLATEFNFIESRLNSNKKEQVVQQLEKAGYRVISNDYDHYDALLDISMKQKPWAITSSTGKKINSYGSEFSLRLINKEGRNIIRDYVQLPPIMFFDPTYGLNSFKIEFYLNNAGVYIRSALSQNIGEKLFFYVGNGQLDEVRTYGSQALDIYLETLNSKDDWVRWYSLYAIEKIEPVTSNSKDRIIKAVEGLLSKERNQPVRSKAEQVLRGME